jgi:hypothetical protein
VLRRQEVRGSTPGEGVQADQDLVAVQGLGPDPDPGVVQPPPQVGLNSEGFGRARLRPEGLIHDDRTLARAPVSPLQGLIDLWVAIDIRVKRMELYAQELESGV